MQRANWENSWQYVTIYVFFDLLQTFLYIIAPWYAWNIYPETNGFWKWLYRAQFQNGAAYSTSYSLAVALM